MNWNNRIPKLLTMLLLMLTLFDVMPFAQASSKIQGYVQTNVNLNLRQKATTASARLATISKGKQVPYYSTKTVSGKTWYQVQYSQKTGWVLGSYVKKVTASTDTAKSKSLTVTDGEKAMTIYPAEKIDWYTGGIQTLIKRGTTFKIYDVKTKRIWTAYRQAGGDHMDIEPASAADTKTLCEIYSVDSADEIAEKNLWRRRPCLVTVNGHTYGCSLYGIPHGKSTIASNNMDGQICLLFTNSKTHGTKKVDSYHKQAIEYALKNAPNGHK